MFEPIKENLQSLLNTALKESNETDHQVENINGKRNETIDEQLLTIEEVNQAKQSISNIGVLIQQYDNQQNDNNDVVDLSNDIILSIKSLLPSFVYIGPDCEYSLNGEVNIDELDLATLDESKYFAVRQLLKLANIDLETLKVLNIAQQHKVLNGASKKISEVIQKRWHQQKIEVNINFTGTSERKLIIWISNNGGPDRFPENQGRGFRWYLDFLFNFALATEQYPKNTVFLVDDAGIYLNQFAQRDLVGLLREISEHNQIIHTTHFPDMLDMEHPENWRIIENNEESGIGSQIINDITELKQGQVGIEVINRALWGSVIMPSYALDVNNLIVEGYSDIIILSTVFQIMDKLSDLDAPIANGDMEMIPVRGPSYYKTAMSFCNHLGLNTVALFHSNHEGMSAKQQLITNKTLLPHKIIEVNDAYVNSGDSNVERDLEDIIGFELLKEAAMQVYHESLPMGFDFVIGSLPKLGGLGSKFEVFFKKQGVEEFDRTKVAQELKRILINKPNKLSDESKEKFLILFSKIGDAFVKGAKDISVNGKDSSTNGKDSSTSFWNTIRNAFQIIEIQRESKN